MALFTPRPQSRNARISLSSKQISKVFAQKTTRVVLCNESLQITNTIASMRQSRAPNFDHDMIDEEDNCILSCLHFVLGLISQFR